MTEAPDQIWAVMIDPDMPDQELRLHMGELTAQEARVARAAIRWANGEGWQSIETAPKDGTPVLLWPGQDTWLGMPAAVTGWWSRHLDWVCNAGMMWPTHWRPLPAPPEKME